MIEHGKFSCNASQDIFGQSFILFNCFHTAPSKTAFMKSQSCSESCSSIDAVIPTYQDFQTLNLNYLVSLCKDEYETNRDSEIESNCDYAISTSFNFTDLT